MRIDAKAGNDDTRAAMRRISPHQKIRILLRLQAIARHRRRHNDPAYALAARPHLDQALAGAKARKDASAQERREAVATLARARKGLPVPAEGPSYVSDEHGTQFRSVTIKAPARLRLDENYDGVLGFLYHYRFRQNVEMNPYKGRPRRLVVDLSEVDEVALDAALALTAEYHRMLLRTPNYRPCIDDAGWPRRVREVFETLGFYDLVNAISQTADVANDDLPSFPIKFVPFVSAGNVDGQVADRLLDDLERVAGRAPSRKAVYGALIEAIKNALAHAYPEDAPPRADPVVHQWWAAGAYFPDHDTLRFAVYDQGVGIPATLKPKPWYQTLLPGAQAERTDADIIVAAVEYGRTRTKQDERGNGLWTISRLAEELPGSRVTILSGRGEVVFPSDGGPVKQVNGNPFCGTLIEWTLVLPQEPTVAGAAA